MPVLVFVWYPSRKI